MPIGYTFFSKKLWRHKREAGDLPHITQKYIEAREVYVRAYRKNDRYIESGWLSLSKFRKYQPQSGTLLDIEAQNFNGGHPLTSYKIGEAGTMKMVMPHE